MSTSTSGLWVAYGSEGSVVGTIRRGDDGYTATIADADSCLLYTSPSPRDRG